MSIQEVVGEQTPVDAVEPTDVESVLSAYPPERRPEPVNQVSRGTVVTDTDRANPDPMVVIKQPPQTAKEWTVYSRNRTVAEDNPDYPADDPVVCCVHLSSFSHPYHWYRGGQHQPLSEIQKQGHSVYIFPEERIEPHVQLPAPQIPLEHIFPSPFHNQSFGIQSDFRLAARLEYDGETFAPLIVRPRPQSSTPGDVELLNGHRRYWAAAVAGFDTIACSPCFLSDQAAAKWFANAHLKETGTDESSYTNEQRREVVEQMSERFTDGEMGYIFEHIDDLP